MEKKKTEASKTCQISRESQNEKGLGKVLEPQDDGIL